MERSILRNKAKACQVHPPAAFFRLIITLSNLSILSNLSNLNILSNLSNQSTQITALKNAKKNYGFL